MTTTSSRQQQIDRAVVDFVARWQAAVEKFGDPQLPPWKRVPEALGSFRGLLLSDLPPRLRRHVDRCFARINGVLAVYQLESWDDYQKMSAADQARIEGLVRRLIDEDRAA